MTEQEWLTCTNPRPMLTFLRGKASDRKLRLFACACCRLIWHRLDDRGREVLEVAERWADGLLNRQQRRSIFARLGESWKLCRPPSCACTGDAFIAAHITSNDVAKTIAEATPPNLDNAAPVIQCRLLRDVCGDLFRHVAIASTWLFWNERTITKLAQAIYEDRAFDRLPILADALEEAGCDNPDILAHCRSGGEHVRGCWVVDLLLNKA